MADLASQKRRSNIFVIILAVVGAITLSTLVFLASMMIWGVSIFSKQLSFGSAGGLSQTATNFIAEIKLEGPISSELIDQVIEKIDSVENMDHARAIFLEVNSPGGTVVASQELYDKILEVRKKKPVLSYYRDVAASGAYYSSASSTWIIANRGSMVGSIGVIMQNMLVKDLLDWAHLKPVTIKTGALKDAGSQVREQTIEDEAYLSQLLKNTHGQFMDDVVKGRNSGDRQKDLMLALQNLKVNTTEETLAAEAAVFKEVPSSTMDYMRDGRVVLGDEASRLGLTDQVGSKLVAKNMLRKFLQEPELELEKIEDHQDFESFLEHYLDRVETWAGNLARKAILQSSSSTPALLAR